MIYTRHFTILIILSLLRANQADTDTQPNIQAQPITGQKLSLSINVPNDIDDLQAEESSPPIIALKQVQFKDEKHYKHHADEVASETNTKGSSPRISVPAVVPAPVVSHPTLASPVLTPLTTYGPQIRAPTKSTTQHQQHFPVTALSPVKAYSPVKVNHNVKAKSRMATEVLKPEPMYYKIIKKVEYGAKPKAKKLIQVQRRQGQYHGVQAVPQGFSQHRVIHHYHHNPHTVKFFIQPSHLKGPKGSKVFVPVVPKPGDKLPKGVKPGGFVLGYPKGKGPMIPKKNKNFGFTPAHIPVGFGQYPQFQQYPPQVQPQQHETQPQPQQGHQQPPLKHQYSQSPVNSHFGHETEIPEQYESEHVIPPWSQGSGRPSHPSAVVPELPEWAQHESYDGENDGFNPVAMSHVYPAKFGAAGVGAEFSGGLGGNVHSGNPVVTGNNLGNLFANFPGQPDDEIEYDPSIFGGFPQGNQAFAQMQAQFNAQQAQGGAGPQYAVQEQSFDVPPPPGPARRPPGSPLPPGPPGPIQTPGLSSQASQAPGPPQMITQNQLQMQFNQMNQQFGPQGPQGPPGFQGPPSGLAGDIDYSAYQPKPAHIGSNPSQSQHPIAHAPAPEHPKHYPSLSPIQDYSPNYLRETPYSGEEQGESHEVPPSPWYQPQQGENGRHTQWSHQIPEDHEQLPPQYKKPNLQASYQWRQKTQDGKLIQVTQNVQESRTELTKVKPSQHFAQHHEVVKKQVSSAPIITEKEDHSSQETQDGGKVPAQNGAQTVQAAQTAPQKESMISNGWTPIINN